MPARKPLRCIDVVNHAVHREASKDGVPEHYTRKVADEAPLIKAPVKRLAKAPRRKP